MSLVKSLLLFVCLLFIYMFVVNATCWIDCYVESYRPLEPYCYLNDDGNHYYCNIGVTPSQLNGLTDNNWNKVRLAINVTNTVTEINRIEFSFHYFDYFDRFGRDTDKRIEVNAFRVFSQLTKLDMQHWFRPILVTSSILLSVPNLKYLNLYSVEFNYFPSFSLTNQHLTYLEINSYKVLSGSSELRSYYVSGLTELKYLELSPRDRTTVTHSAFSGLTALTRLEIENMRLSNPVSILAPLVRLKGLIIFQCELTSIKFLKQTPGLYQLTYLNFGYNRIRSFSDEVFTNYTELKYLWLSSNSISVINRSNFTQLGNVESLSLTRNQISSIPPDTFKDMPLLTRIYLDHNPITTLSSRVFEHLTGIRRIFGIFLFFNRFHCDCTLQWMSVVEQEYGIYLYSPRCQTPTEYRGRVPTDPVLYTNCTRDLSYDCFNRSVECPRGSLCEDTIDSHLCACEGEGVAFSSSLNRCINYEKLILASQGQFLTDTDGHATFVPHTSLICPTTPTTVQQPINNCPICPTTATPDPTKSAGS